MQLRQLLFRFPSLYVSAVAMVTQARGGEKKKVQPA